VVHALLEQLFRLDRTWVLADLPQSQAVFSMLRDAGYSLRNVKTQRDWLTTSDVEQGHCLAVHKSA
jgi:hypothetical protein